MNMQRPIGLLPVALLAATCGSSAGPSGPVTLEKVPTEIAKVLCAKVYSCCSATERMGNLFAGTDQKSCETTVSAFTALAFTSVQESITKGRIAYHGDRMAVCLEKMNALDCPAARMTDLGENTIPECETAFEPKVATGAPCAEDGECILPGYCQQGPGTCAPTKADGQPCSLDPECTGGECAGGTCRKAAVASDNLCK